MSERTTKVLNNLKRLQGDRDPWEDLFQDITTYVVPRGGDFWRIRQKGDGRFEDIFDGTAVQALNTAASGLFSRVTNPASKWFFLRINDREAMDDKEVKIWLEDARDTVQSIINRHLSVQMFQTFKQTLSYGTGILFIEEDDKTDVAGQVFGLAQTWVDTDFAGNIDTVYRIFRLSAGNALKKWPEGLSSDTRVKAKTNPETMVDFLHIVQPRENRDIDKVDSLNMPWESLWIETGNKNLITEGGFEEFPYVTPRLDVLAGEKYGRSPAMEALPDVLTLNALVRLELDAANMSIRPPMDIPDEAYATPFDLTPAAKNYNQHPQGAKASPITVAGDIRITSQTKTELRAQIRKIFLNDELRLAQGPRKTATETLAIQQENNLLMSPWQTRLEPEFLERIINRVFNIAMRRGKLLEPPQILQDLLNADREIVVTYDSPLARAQKGQDVQAIDDTLFHIGQVTQAGFPVHQNYDIDKMSRARSESKGLPVDFIIDEAEVEAQREADAAQAQAEQAAAAAQQAAETGATAAQIPGVGEAIQEEIEAA